MPFPATLGRIRIPSIPSLIFTGPQNPCRPGNRRIIGYDTIFHPFNANIFFHEQGPERLRNGYLDPV